MKNILDQRSHKCSPAWAWWR